MLNSDPSLKSYIQMIDEEEVRWRYRLGVLDKKAELF